LSTEGFSEGGQFRPAFVPQRSPQQTGRVDSRSFLLGQGVAKAKRMFERYSQATARSLFAAKAIALAAGSRCIDETHLLAGAVETWAAAGSFQQEVLKRLGFAAPSTTSTASPEIAFSPLVKRLLNQAMAQADRLDHHRIRPEHFLLAMLDEPDGSAAVILRDVGLERAVLVQSAAADAALDDSPLNYGPGRVRLQSYVPDQSEDSN